MRIAVDYDNTYTEDPVLWDAFIGQAMNRGHDVYIVTARDDQYDRTPALIAVERTVRPNHVVYCRGIAKRWYCLHFGPGAIDVWIDDRPEAILANSTATPEDLAAWRASPYH